MRAKTIEYPLYLIHRDGRSAECHDAATLWGIVRGEGGEVGLYHHRVLPDNRVKTYPWVVRDCLGCIVTPENIHARKASKQECRLKRKKTRHPGYGGSFRDGIPVPGTGVRHRGHYHRRAHYLAFRRDAEGAFLLMDDFEEDQDIPSILPAIVGKWQQMQSAPPCSWNSGPMASHYDRSWKRFRRTQWRSAGIS